MPAENGTNDVTPPPPRTDEDNSADNGEQLPLEQAEQVPNGTYPSNSLPIIPFSQHFAWNSIAIIITMCLCVCVCFFIYYLFI